MTKSKRGWRINDISWTETTLHFVILIQNLDAEGIGTLEILVGERNESLDIEIQTCLVSKEFSFF